MPHSANLNGHFWDSWWTELCRFWKFGLFTAIAAGICLESGASGKLPVPLQVEFFGCTAIRDTAAGRICMMTPAATLAIWVANRACRELAISEGGKPVPTEAYDNLQGGCQLRIAGGKQQPNSTLTMTDLRSGRPWTMPIDRSNSRLLEWTNRIADRKSADLEETVAELRRLMGQALDAETYTDVLYAFALAQMELGNLNDATRELGHVVQYASSVGLRSIALEAAYHQAELLVRNGLTNDARAVLKTMASLSIPGDSRSLTYLEWETGHLAGAEERFDEATSHMAGAIAAMQRVHDVAFQRLAIPFLLQLRIRLDQLQEIAPLLSSVAPLLDDTTGCQRALLLKELAISGLVLAESRDITAPGLPIKLGSYKVRDLLNRAVNSGMNCHDDIWQVNLDQAMTWLNFFEGQYPEAQRWLAHARTIPERTVMDDLELLDAEAQLAVATGKGEASRSLFKALDELSSRNPTYYRREFECRTAIGTLEALRLLGQEDANVVQSVRGCIEQHGNQPAAAEVRWVARRAKAAGLTVP